MYILATSINLNFYISCMLAFVSIRRVLNSKMLSFATLSNAPKSPVSYFTLDWYIYPTKPK
ncbi:hypothetical protein F6P74_05295 [Streptococcus suis]|nr:hypothetical protein [Streptococcus suis]MBS8094078.1 hypothetical protein [Streptococcus suis]MBS8102660.1 hypothetical protein [Streptococcus suis]